MRKIIIGIVALFLFIIGWQSFSIFSYMKEPVLVRELNALEYINNHLSISEIQESSFYHGTESFQVLHGTNKDGKAVIVWVADTLDAHHVEERDAGLSYENVLRYTQEKLNPKEIISINLGMENQIPLYEIVFKDQQDRFSYYYISFKNGTYLKHFHLTM